MKKGSRKTSLQIYFTSLFIARVRKGCSRFACERVLETEHKLHILTPLLWSSRCVFLVLLMFNQRPKGPLLDAGFLYGILSASSLDPKLHWGFQAPSAWCGFPYHISSLTLWNSTGNCFGLSNSTELNNNSMPTRSPTGSLKSNV